MIRSRLAFLCVVFAALLLPSVASAANTYVIMNYETARRDIQAEQPFSFQYDIQVTAYFDVPAPLTVPLQVVSLRRPAGVTEAAALSFVSLSRTSLSFTADSQRLPVTISINVPTGQKVGDYGYAVKVPPATWASTLTIFDEGSFINMEVRDKAAPVLPPTLQITNPTDAAVFTYRPAQGPLVIPFAFGAAAVDATPILSVDADLNGASLTVASTGLGTTTVGGSGSLRITAPGLYTLRARASNSSSTVTDTVDFQVNVDAPPPTVTVAQPSNGATYTYVTGGSPVQVPVSFTVDSLYGPVTDVSATLNGNAISTLTKGGLNTTKATGTATLSLSTPGTYTLVYRGTNGSGSATASVTFTVVGAMPTPVVTINQPTAGTTISRVAGSAATAVPYSFSVSTPAGTIQSISLTLNGAAVTPTAGGLNTANATGSGNFSVSAPGTYTIVATGSNGGAVASATRTFTVVETTPPAPDKYTLCWLSPIADGTPINGGEKMGIRFNLLKNGSAVSDNSVIVAVYELYTNGGSSNPTYYSSGGYSLSGNVYSINYTTATGDRRYKVEVYRSSTTAATLVGTKEFTTKKAPSYDDYYSIWWWANFGGWGGWWWGGWWC